jgi:hypothetical protein
MRIYRLSEFLNLPEGTFFLKGVQWCFDDICIKGATIGNDFLYVSMREIEYSGVKELMDRYEMMRDNGASFPLSFEIQRDESFHDGDLFLVYELEDLELFHTYLSAGIKMLRHKRRNHEPL